MALKLRIDAVDAEVKNLEGSFAALNKFAEQALKTSGKWHKIGPDFNAALKTQREIQALTLHNISETERATQSLSRFQSTATAITKVFANLGSEIKTTAKNLLSVTYSFTNLGLMTIVGAGVGLLGLGVGLAGYGFLGLENVASRLGSGRRTAMGLGANYGGMSSFGTNFGRFVDPESFLGNVFTGRYDITSRQRLALMVAGINPSGDTSQQAAELLAKTPSMLRGTPEGLIGARAQSLGLLDILSLEEITRYLRASPQEQEQQLKHFREDKKTFDVPPGVLEAWAKMNTQLDRAYQVMQTHFAEKLVGLATPIDHLSSAFVERVNQIINSKLTADVVDMARDGIVKFGAFLESDQFKKGMSSFISGMQVLLPITKKLYDIVKYLIKIGYYGAKWLLSDGETQHFVPGVALPNSHHYAPEGTPGPRLSHRPYFGQPYIPNIRHGRRRGESGGGYGISPYGDPLHPNADYPPQPSGDYHGLRILPGHGATGGGPAQAGLNDAARTLQEVYPGVGFTALNDTAHRWRGLGSGATGPHARGRAFDAVLGDIEEGKRRLRQRLSAAGFVEGEWGSGRGDYSIEPGTGGGTGPHLHFQWNSNAAAQRYHEYISNLRHEKNRRHFGFRGRQRAPHNADFRDNLASSAHTPKRITIQNDTTLAVGVPGHVYG